MGTNDDYPWTRRDDESHQAYEAFRIYLKVRSTSLVSEETGKSMALMTRWCSRHEWVARVIEYDRFMERASTDDHAGELGKVRIKQLDITNKLLDHLDHRLDEFIRMNADPSIRWTNAFVAATKAQLAALQLRDVNNQLSDRIDEVMEKLERISSGSQ